MVSFLKNKNKKIATAIFPSKSAVDKSKQTEASEEVADPRRVSFPGRARGVSAPGFRNEPAGEFLKGKPQMVPMGSFQFSSELDTCFPALVVPCAARTP